MRVLVAGFQHETNSFAPTLADWTAFERGDFFPPYARGPAMLERHRHGGMPIAGFLAEAEAAGWAIEASCWAGASPSGPVTRGAFERIRAEICGDVAAMRDKGLDGIYLDLHGAAVCEHLDSPEAMLLAEVRSVVGEGVPIVASVDLHANVDGSLLTHADRVTAYRTYPHVDMLETGARAFAALRERLEGSGRDRYALRRIPFLLPIVSQATSRE
ncbi:M81 family peptidase, partial [bacterium]